VIGGGDMKSDNESLDPTNNNDTIPITSDTKNDETIIDQQSTLWGASSGIEWQGKSKVIFL
jgi:hypothetical protein